MLFIRNYLKKFTIFNVIMMIFVTIEIAILFRKSEFSGLPLLNQSTSESEAL